jgi:hypothetical protein
MFRSLFTCLFNFPMEVFLGGVHVRGEGLAFIA